MREFTCDSLLEWYALLQQNVRDLGDEHFESFTPTERDELRADLLEEIRKDYAFKLLTLLEADIREDEDMGICECPEGKIPNWDNTGCNKLVF